MSEPSTSSSISLPVSVRTLSSFGYYVELEAEVAWVSEG